MNFLAHAYLSGNNTKILLGNFIADFVKGKQALAMFEPDVVKGIEFHRAIDEFTDTHPVVQQSKDRLRPTYRHYAAVIVDVFYDHYLSRYWDNYHATPLPQFADDVYQTISGFDKLLPTKARHMLPYMISENWLVNYGNFNGIARALTGMAKRTPYPSKMDEAVDDLRKYYDQFKQEFEEFFPVLETHSMRFLNTIS
jgi:acyl carrier protein phosphodiesterase